VSFFAYLGEAHYFFIYMKKLNQYENKEYYKILKFLKTKPRSRAEAQDHVNKIYPGSGMKIFWHKKEIGPYRWDGFIYCPIVKKKISSSECYSLSHGLMSWVFNRDHGGNGGIAENVYGLLDNVISQRQEKRMLSWKD